MAVLCTLDGIGYFPDAPTERGVKHLHELAQAKAAGVKVLFLLCRVGRDSLEIIDQREG